MRLLFRVLFGLLTLVVLAGAFSAAAAYAVYLHYAPDLPQASDLREIRLQTPLQIRTSDGQLMSEYAEQRRIPVSIDAIPERMKQAFIAAEDERFAIHPGVDPVGLARAALNLWATGDRSQGGSTITMQVARNFFLTRERTYDRKLREIVLAIQIERELSKDQILELYLNKIYLGHRAYGVAAAAQVYYDLPLEQLSLGQVATIAALPKAPSTTNPVTSPQRAEDRRNYVLRRMLQLGYITHEEHDEARAEPIVARLHGAAAEVSAHWAAETARQMVVNAFGEDAYVDGYIVYTTLDSRIQPHANRAVQRGILAYERRHGFRVPEARLPSEVLSASERIDQALQDQGRLGGYLIPAVVLASDATRPRIRVWHADRGHSVQLSAEATRWAGNAVSRLQPGHLVWLEPASSEPIDPLTFDPSAWKLAQEPAVGGALVVQDPASGALLAWSSGFDFFRNRFDHVRQAQRQPGSAFKPFIYATALEQGWTPDSTVNDAPMIFSDPALGAEWRPENYTREFYGPTTLRAALAASRNLASIRLLNEVGIGTVHDRLGPVYGLDPSAQPRNLSLTLGTGTTPPLALNSAYAVFANGGRHVEPWLIQRIERPNGEVVYQVPDASRCESPCQPVGLELAVRLPDGSLGWVEPEPILDPGVAWQMTQMLAGVIQGGTGRAAASLGRSDLAGKTGTTNEYRDAWFSGYNADLVATAWVGFDNNDPLGSGEAGGRAALPIWIDFMRSALDGREAAPVPRPDSLQQRGGGWLTERQSNAPRSGGSSGRDDADTAAEDRPEMIF